MRSKLIGSHVPRGTRSGRVTLTGLQSAAVGRWLAGAGAALAVLTAAACSSPGGTGTGGATASPSPAAASTGAASSLEQQYEQVVARVLPSVVQISTSSGSGSGVVYDTKGDIVTNASRRWPPPARSWAAPRRGSASRSRPTRLPASPGS
jgi:hypothetical protein